jgi:hypothetical protein
MLLKVFKISSGVFELVEVCLLKFALFLE